MSDQKVPNNPNYPPQYQPQKKKSKWWIPVAIIGSIIILFFVFIFIVIGAIGSSFSSFEKQEVSIKENSVLYMTFGGDIGEYNKQSMFNFGGSSNPTFWSYLRAIEAAKDDDRIKGIFIRSKMSGLGFAKSIEIQQALEEFKESGKFIYTFIETARENEYYNALPSDSIFMPEEGLMEMNGYGISSMFLKGLFKKIGVEYYVLGFEDFKSAGESLSRDNFSDSSRYQLQIILAQRYKYLTESIAKFRKMDIAKVNEIIARGIFTADSLKEYGFIDGFATESEVKEFIKKRVFGEEKAKDEKNKLNLISVGNYVSGDLPKGGEVYDENTQIAIIYGEGPIQDMDDDNPFGGEKIISSKEVISNLKKARDDKKIKAIILRVNSPGGSVITSDAIYQEILKTREVKPVFASMGDVAASGGYYISMPCDTIIASPGTITGSIGVILAVPNLSETMNMLDIGVDTISTSPNANIMNGLYPYNENDKKFLYDVAEPIYKRFVQKVSKNRNMTFEEARSLAKGRVWTGEDAKERGLVDVLGGYKESLKIAKRRIGVPDSMKVWVQVFPKEEDPIEMLLKTFGIMPQDDEEVRYDPDLSKILNINPAELAAGIDALPEDVKAQLLYINQLMKMSKKEKALFSLPYPINIH